MLINTSIKPLRRIVHYNQCQLHEAMQPSLKHNVDIATLTDLHYTFDRL